MPAQRKRIAIACQGGGSHTAFTAGVLQRLLREDYSIVALSGTPGGAICALLAWYGLLLGDRDRAGELLEGFWQGIVAADWPDWLFNRLTVGGTRLRNWVTMMEVSPYALPESGYPTALHQFLCNRAC